MSTPSRVTPADVREILETTLDDTMMQIWIDAASEIVDQNADCINGDEALLTQIELYLSAHLMSILPSGGNAGGIVTKQKFDVMETTYSSASATVTKQLNSTVYGQTANMLSKGCLASSEDEKATYCALGGTC